MKHPACDVCGAPLKGRRGDRNDHLPQQWQLSDGRLVCAQCHATAVVLPSEATALYEEMKMVAAHALGITLNVPTGLALVDRNQLGEVIRQQMQKKPGMQTSNAPQPSELDPERTLGIYARRGMRRGIYVQTGLPRMAFFQVAAHEYAHAWQGENCPGLQNPMIHEGFAEWVAFHILGYYGFAKGQKDMLRRSDVYGQGLRWLLEVEHSQGATAVMQICRRGT